MRSCSCNAFSGGGSMRWMPVPNLSTSASHSGAQSRNSVDSSASAASPSSSSTASSNVRPTPASIGISGIPPTGLPQMPLPPGANPADFFPVDPCLPCRSQHFLNRQAQMAAAPTAGPDQVSVQSSCVLLLVYHFIVYQQFMCLHIVCA